MVVVVLVLEGQVERISPEQLLLRLGEVLRFSRVQAEQLNRKHRVAHAPRKGVHPEPAPLQRDHDGVSVIFSVAVARQKRLAWHHHPVLHVAVHVSRYQVLRVVLYVSG